MYEKIITKRVNPVVTVPQLAAFGRFDVPQHYVTGSSPQVETDDWALLETFIEAATDEIENTAATACLNEEILLTFDFFPGQQDPRSLLNYELSYAFNVTPWWWYGFPTKDSIELVRRPVIVPSGSPVVNPVTVQYVDPNGATQTLNPTTYTVGFDKITLIPGNSWPLTDMRQDCIQITYSAGYHATDSTQVPARLRMAIMFLAAHFWENRSIVSIEPTSEIHMTLCRMLSSFRSMRIPH
jgi:hypothetical protein